MREDRGERAGETFAAVRVVAVTRPVVQVYPVNVVEGLKRQDERDVVRVGDSARTPPVKSPGNENGLVARVVSSESLEEGTVATEQHRTAR